MNRVMIEKGEWCSQSGFLSRDGKCRSPDGCFCKSIADALARAEKAQFEVARLEEIIIMTDKDFDGDSPHDSAADRLVNGLKRIVARLAAAEVEGHLLRLSRQVMHRRAQRAEGKSLRSIALLDLIIARIKDVIPVLSTLPSPYPLSLHTLYHQLHAVRRHAKNSSGATNGVQFSYYHQLWKTAEKQRDDALTRLAAAEAANAALEAQVARLEQWQVLSEYVLQDEFHNRLIPRVVDIAYSAFMNAKRPNNEDGGPTDWFTDTRPMVMQKLAEIRAALAEVQADARREGGE